MKISHKLNALENSKIFTKDVSKLTNNYDNLTATAVSATSSSQLLLQLHRSHIKKISDEFC